MVNKETLIFSDRNIKPADESVFNAIGDKKVLWQRIMSYLKENCKDAEGTWNYYNDGKQWLYKVVQKKKTIFWLAVMQGSFRITFYFGDKAEPAILESELPQDVKDGFLLGKHYGKIRAISTRVMEQDDVDVIKMLAEIKMKIK